MTFRYTYRTSDGSWHEAEIVAPDKNAVYDELKPKGIRPIKVWCPNPPLIQLSKRWIAIILLAAALCVTVWAYLRQPSVGLSPSAVTYQASVPRHRIMSAPTDFARLSGQYFAYSAERFLALHSQPGLLFPLGEENLDDLPEALQHETEVGADDPEWVIGLKRVVSGMKIEAGILLKNGKSPPDIALWLVERQKMEATYRNQIIAAPGTLEEKAKRLRAMGL